MAHNLGVAPWRTQCLVVNVEPDIGYEPGQIASCGFESASGYATASPIHATRLRMGVPPMQRVRAPHAESGVPETLTASKWAYKFVAQRGW